MELYISRQLFQLICSALAGFGIGLAYDVFRILRRRLKTDAMFDALFWLCCLSVLFTLGMDIGGGALHIFMLAFAILGFAAYMLALSEYVMVLLNKAAQIISRALSPVKKLFKFFSKVVKKFFSNIRDWFTMIKKKRNRSRSGQNEEDIDSGGDRAHGSGRICYPEPDKRPKKSEGRNGADGAASGGYHSGADGKQRIRGKNSGAGKRRGHGRAGEAAAETDKTR